MPVVFVHGVNVRKGPGYETGLAVTKKFLQAHLAGATINGKKLKTVEPVFPYWGDLATTFAWEMASLPSGEIDSLGVGGVDENLRPLVALVNDALTDPSGAQNEPLTRLAQQDLELAVHVISRLLMEHVNDLDAEKAASFIVAAQAYARANPHPAWLSAVNTDAQFTNVLAQEVKAAQPAASQPEALGPFDFITNPLAAVAAKFKNAVKHAAGTVLDRTGDFASTKLLGWTRQSLNANLGRFFGDVFIYFNTRGPKENPGPIPKIILKAFEDATQAGPPEEPLVIIGHSLGGVISYDLLTHFAPREVDLFVTVGSQVPHFEELKLFRSSDKNIPSPAQKLAPVPPHLRRWINVFDVVDIFSYSAKRIFDRVDDFGYDTKTYVVKAHGAYFEQDRFYERLRHRIDNP
ncbi:MAG: hypothetical protein WAO00_10830 [Chthoniobacterales bacterium]